MKYLISRRSILSFYTIFIIFIISALPLFSENNIPEKINVVAGPMVTTDPATSISATGATLNGTVNANGESTNVTFQYGLTVAYGTTVTADQAPVTGSTDTAVSNNITGLTPNTTYHYRAVGVNGSGTTYGADMTFTTTAAGNSPQVVTEPATAVGTTSATLNGLVCAEGQSTIVTFEYGTDTSYGTTINAEPATLTSNLVEPVSKSLDSLSPNTTYHFRVVGTNASGTSYGDDRTFTTSSIPPSTVTSAATSVTLTEATLNGIINANNDSTTATFEYGITPALGSTVTADQSPVTGTTNIPVSKSITGLSSDTTYYFRAAGQNGSGTTYGAVLTFQTESKPREKTYPSVKILNLKDVEYVTGIQRIEAEALSDYGISSVDFYIDDELLGPGRISAPLQSMEEIRAYIIGSDSIIKKVDRYGNTTPLFNRDLHASAITLRDNNTIFILFKSAQLLSDNKKHILAKADLRTGQISGIDHRIKNVATDFYASSPLQSDKEGNLYFMVHRENGTLEVRKYSQDLKKESAEPVKGRITGWQVSREGEIVLTDRDNIDGYQGIPRFSPSGMIFLGRPENGGMLILRGTGKELKDRDFEEVVFVNERIRDFTVPEADVTDGDKYFIDWDTSEYPYGAHTVKAIACDLYGAESEDSVTVNIPGLVLDLDAVKMEDKAWIITKYYGEISITIENPQGIEGVKYRVLRRTGGGEFTEILEFTESDLDGDSLVYKDKYLEKERSYIYVIEARGEENKFVLLSPEVNIK